MIDLLKEKGAKLNNNDVLVAASGGGLRDVVKCLLEKGTDVNSSGALQNACAGGFKDIVEILLDSGANVNAEGGKYGTALQAASAKGHNQIAQRLLEKGADVHAQFGGFSPLSVATISRNKRLMEMLFAGGPSIVAALKTLEHLDEPGKFLRQTAICLAAATSNETMMNELIDTGADVNSPSKPNIKTPLHFAVESGRVNVVRALLAANADPTREDESGRTAYEHMSVLRPLGRK